MVSVLCINIQKSKLYHRPDKIGSSISDLRQKVFYWTLPLKVCDETIPVEVDEDEAEEDQVSSDPDRPHDMGVERTDQVSQCRVSSKS